ncbi:MAG: GAF domain-containing sensor histidine kinase [Deltaproteobacteria bacterium]|nr:GAF domain-containing sensor histidine kinase [Deltaproteobacteria bacterium]
MGDEKCESFIGLPLLIRDEVIGVLKAENKIVDSAHPEPYFTPEEEQVFEILASIAAIVVRNATLITDEEKRRKDLINVYQIGSLLQEQEDVDRLLYIFLLGLTHKTAIGFNRAMYFEYHPLMKQLIGRMAICPIGKKVGENDTKQFYISKEFLSIDSAIADFDDGRQALHTELNRYISDTIINLEKGDFLSDLAVKGKKFFEEYDISYFSHNLRMFLKNIVAKKIILIGIAPSKGKYSFIICDNIHGQKLLEQSTKELLDSFIGQMSKALERVYSTEEVKAAKEAAWQEASAMAAHQLGNILPFTENRIKEALNICIDNDHLQILLSTCQEDMRAAINVLHDFLGFAAVGSINLSDAEDVNHILNRLETTLKADFKDIDIHTTYLEIEPIPRIRIDFDNIKIVFSSLLVNTIDAGTENRMVEISLHSPSDDELRKCGLRPKGNFIKFFYKDNGPGIPDEEKEKIFEVFFTTKQGSSGLGLAIVRRSIEQHGGKIFEDGKRNQGVRFNIFLPLH